MQYEEVKELIAIFEKTDLTDMELQLDNAIIKLSRGQAGNKVPAAQITQQTGISSSVETVNNITSADNTQSTEAGNTASTEEHTYKEDVADANAKYIKAPIVGTFYQSASPEKPPYVEVGDTVAAGDVVCIIEAMKFMNEVTSEESGKIVEVMVEDGQFVEFGQPLFRVE